MHICACDLTALDRHLIIKLKRLTHLLNIPFNGHMSDTLFVGIPQATSGHYGNNLPDIRKKVKTSYWLSSLIINLIKKIIFYSF